MKNKWGFITPPKNSFAGLPVCTNLDELEADIAVIGTHYISSYPNDFPLKYGPDRVELASDTIRFQSTVYKGNLNHFDFNFNSTLLEGKDIRIVDCGDVDYGTVASKQTPEHITEAVRAVLDRGAVPFVIGTDEGGLIPVLRAHEGRDKSTGSICVIHFDAHIDWKDENEGVREGYSSGMIRASEMSCVGSMAQIGLRGMGSAGQKEVDNASAFGSVFISSRDVHEKGVAACLGRIPRAEKYFITIDSDVLDIAIAPGVLFPSPGGLTFDEISGITRGIADKGIIAGINLFEVRPERDINNITSSTAAYFIVNFFGILLRSGQVQNMARISDS